MPGFRLRCARADDAEVLVAIVLEGFGTYRAFAPNGWQPPQLREDDESSRLEDVDTWCLVAELDGGELVGHVALMPATKHFFRNPDPILAHLWQLFVRPPYWGTGLATRLLSAAVAEAGSRGYAAIRLFTAVDHTRAMRFYRREGFSPVGEPFESKHMTSGLTVVECRRGLADSAPDRG